MVENDENGGLLYSKLSACYDPFFRWITAPRQKSLIRRIPLKPGDKILDLGVGTGVSLPIYPDFCHVTGVDNSPDMLSRARRRIEKKDLENVDLVQADAMKIDRQFSRNTFDYVVAAFVLSVVDDPVRMLKNMKAVGKRDGSFYVLNHFRSRNPVLRKCERIMDPIGRKLGWNYEVDAENVMREAGLSIVWKKPCYPLDLFTIIHAKNGRS